MNLKISEQIQAEQNHGREKWGNGADDVSQDDANTDSEWHSFIGDHNARAKVATPMDRRQHLIKLAGLAVSAIEAIDRRLLTA
jgi:hypothetical protein